MLLILGFLGCDCFKVLRLVHEVDLPLNLADCLLGCTIFRVMLVKPFLLSIHFRPAKFVVNIPLVVGPACFILVNDRLVHAANCSKSVNKFFAGHFAPTSLDGILGHVLLGSLRCVSNGRPTGRELLVEHGAPFRSGLRIDGRLCRLFHLSHLFRSGSGTEQRSKLIQVANFKTEFGGLFVPPFEILVVVE